MRAQGNGAFRLITSIGQLEAGANVRLSPEPPTVSLEGPRFRAHSGSLIEEGFRDVYKPALMKAFR